VIWARWRLVSASLLTVTLIDHLDVEELDDAAPTS
jgi:hypothetical protein